MRVSVDNDICDARGQCNVVDPELFTLDEDGYSDIGQGKQVPAGKEDIAEQGVEICPVQALYTD
ncbi:ferredoxin [Saccharopolyspora lacisalsi]|uniref:Ferredoxin n=1 Tax=Halosaccharopolyspora lacisalsi TaxID=1000566 RepID=A0A839DSD5_9PSEU|nr:ferredoxin [Halosaccharopolyspora lacisalsi]MBA8823870.1 ferredoxin [Halosaccharopolyspora lacisalsi]